jgi:oxygen-independent coproporphyrinogen-3 oxidase
MTTINLQQLPPLSLYIHIPWCIKKCPYCDFNSHTAPSPLPEHEYIASLIRDLELALPLVWGRTVHSIFIGGGTPSLFSGQSIEYLLKQVRARLPISPYAEITLEANPGTVEKQYIAEYAQAGVNRISLGIQSFNNQHLAALGRIHSQEEALSAIETVASNFTNFNLDLMYGLPGQTLQQAREDISLATSFGATHISAYNLTIEPNTEFAKRTPHNLPDDDTCYHMQEEIINTLAAAGYNRYEVSAYAKSGWQSKHNLNYWQFGDYLGIGAGAHSKLSYPEQILRQVRHKHPQEYRKAVATANHLIEDKPVATTELSFEFMLNALRLVDGFELSLFANTTGLAVTTILPQLLQAQQQGLIALPPGRVNPTSRGLNYLNNLLELFLPSN